MHYSLSALVLHGVGNVLERIYAGVGNGLARWAMIPLHNFQYGFAYLLI